MIEQYLGDYMREDGRRSQRIPRPRPAAARQRRSEPFGMTVLALRLANMQQRRQQAARQRVAEDVEGPSGRSCRGAKCRSRRSPTASTRRAGCRRRSAQLLRPLPRHPVGRTADRLRHLEARRAHPRRRTVADARAPPRAAGRLRPRPAASRSSSAAGRRPSRSPAADEVLDPDALTIGFARRFATYKRGDLIFRNPERLAPHPEQQGPAGAVHLRRQGPPEGPRRQGTDRAQSCSMPRKPEFRRRVVFIEDYDMNVARYLVQGVDVWLNNPRRPLEASGTSGMKVAGNGGLNLSILDGWWVRGLRRRQRLGHRRRRGVHRPHLPGRRREPGPVRPARAGDRADVLHPRQRTACRATWIRRMKQFDHARSCRCSTPTAWSRSTRRSAMPRRTPALAR